MLPPGCEYSDRISDLMVERFSKVAPSKSEATPLTSASQVLCKFIKGTSSTSKYKQQNTSVAIPYHIYIIIKGSLEDTSELRRVEERCNWKGEGSKGDVN